jgi:hypothetical protein
VLALLSSPAAEREREQEQVTAKPVAREAGLKAQPVRVPQASALQEWSAH